MLERCKKILVGLGIDPDSVNFEVSLVSPEVIRELNKIHRGKDKVTDVLSFPFLNLERGQMPSREAFPLDINPETGKVELGDIIINENEADKDALIEHGLLHLLGYHHKGDE